MDENFDTGDIIDQKKIGVTQMETMGTLFNRLNIVAFNMLLDTLKKYEKSPLKAEKQPQGDFPKGKINGEDIIFIDYKKHAIEIERFVRALNPFIIAATNFRKNVVKVFAAEIVDEKTSCAAGSIVAVNDDKLYIATGNGLFVPTVLQFGSFFIGSSKDFIRILNPQVGEKFT